MKNRIILQVEDDPNDVILLDVAFKQAEISSPVRVVSNGHEAIDYLSGRGSYEDRGRFPLPGLILLDLHLPRISGIEVLDYLAQEPTLRHIPVVVMSSSNQPEDVWQCYENGVNAYVMKPLTNAERRSLACAIKAFWIDLNILSPVLTSQPQNPRRPSGEQTDAARWNISKDGSLFDH